MRTECTKPKLRGFEFEELSQTVGHRIYRELLLKPKWFDDHSAAESDDNSYCVPTRRSTKKPPVSCMERIGSHGTSMGASTNPSGTCRTPKRRFVLVTTVVSSPKCVSIPALKATRKTDAMYLTTTNFHRACQKLALNDLKILKIDFINSLGRRLPDWTHNGYYAERCLEPLKKCRAQKVSVDSVRGCTTGLKLTSFVAPHQCVYFLLFGSPSYAAELKAVIEGPKDVKFLTYRKAMEEEPESDFGELPNNGMEKVKMLDSEDIEEIGTGDSGNEDEGAETTHTEAGEEADMNLNQD